MNYLIVGLGNVGASYVGTRHNIGFMVLDHIAQQYKVDFEVDKKAYQTHIQYKGRRLYLIKPTTYMNLSGEAVQFWLQRLRIPQHRLLVVSDDIHLPLGKLRLCAKGGSGGHNGIAHIQACLGSQDFPRLRCGIGKRFLPGGQADYVLGNFSPQEQPVVNALMVLVAQAIQDFCTLPIALAMNKYNRRME